MIISKFLAVIPLISSLVLSACSPEEERSVTKHRSQAHKVSVSLAEIKPVQHSQIVSGTVEAIKMLKLYNEESSRITKLPFYESDPIDAGDILVELDERLIRADLDKAIAQRKQAEVSLQRLKKLQPKKLASEEDVTLAKTTLDVARAEEKRQRTRLNKTRIKAPFAGIISQRLFEPGDVIPANSHILSLIDPEQLRIRLQVSERWVALISLGTRVDVSIDALGDRSLSGIIERIHPTIDAATRKGTIEVVLNPYPEGARAGQLARVNIQTEISERLVVPSRSIHHDIDGAHVFIVKDDRARKTPIRQGLDFAEYTEVLSGVEAGDAIVSKGFLGLRHNKTVKAYPENER